VPQKLKWQYVLLATRVCFRSSSDHEEFSNKKITVIKFGFLIKSSYLYSLNNNKMGIFTKRQAIIPIPITPTEAELQKIIKEYYSRQNKKKKKWKDLIKL